MKLTCQHGGDCHRSGTETGNQNRSIPGENIDSVLENKGYSYVRKLG